MPNNLPKFDVQIIWQQQEHLKKTNIFYFGSPHIIEPWALKY
jgi:hypothetical protein